jgi:hypothetical protein
VSLTLFFQLNLFSSKSRENRDPMMMQYVLAFLVIILLTTSSVALAECPIREHSESVQNQTSLQMSSGVRLAIEGELLRVESSDSQSFHYSIKQPDSGPPTSIIELSATRFVVLGPVESFLGVFAENYSKREDLSINPLPIRYDASCSFWTHVRGTCPVASARFSPALQAVVVSGWVRSGLITRLIHGDSINTLLVANNDDPKPLELEDGSALIYFWDDYEGNAVLSTRAGEGFLLKPGSKFVRCGLYPPLDDKLYIQ